MKVIITTRKFQRRKHRKKRINKKWANRYGFKTIEVQEPGQMYIMGGRGSTRYLYIRQDDYDRLVKEIKFKCNYFVTKGEFDRLVLGGNNNVNVSTN